MSKLTKEDKDAIKKTYRAMDENGDGRVSKAEVKRASKRLGINFSDQEVNAAMGEIDENDDGYLNYKEFEKMILDHIEGEAMEMKIIRKIFRTMDVDGDGKVTCKEIVEALKISKEQAQELLVEADTNKDGKMSFEEFVNVYRGKNG